MKYTLQDGADVCKAIEPAIAAIGIHAAIGGSLAYRGDSTKDIDIILYPHNREVIIDRQQIVALLAGLGYHRPNGDDYQSSAVPDVHCAADGDGKRVDFFFMQRSEFFPKPNLEGVEA